MFCIRERFKQMIPSAKCHLKRLLTSNARSGNVPMLVGPSRKRFLGEICDRANPVGRDPATVAAATSAILGGANIIRVQNASFGVDTAKICDALLKERNAREFFYREDESLRFGICLSA